jgi:hypothetical protein
VDFVQFPDLFGLSRVEETRWEIVRIAFSADTNNLLAGPWRERIDNVIFDMRESNRPKVSIRQTESQHVFHDIQV